MTQEAKVQVVFFNQRNSLRKFFWKKTKLEKTTGARSISLAEFIQALKASEQIDEELTPAAVKEIWLATISFDVRPDLVSEGDTTIEVRDETYILNPLVSEGKNHRRGEQGAQR
jgi:hypothetical protein